MKHPRNLVCSLLLVAAIAGCTWRSPIAVNVPPTLRRPDRCAVVLFVDGLDAATMERLAGAGELPNIQRHLLARGVRTDHAVTVIPSITFAANVSLNTGQFPGHHGITGNTWFDRNSLLFEDYKGICDYQRVDSQFTPPTFFEMIPDLYTVSVLTPVHRGSTRHFANWLSTGVTWFFGNLRQVDALTAYRTNEIGREAARTGRWPDAIWFYFPGVDHIGHEHGKESPQYRDAVRNIDDQVGRIATGLQQAGVYDRTLLVLVADHGQETTDPAKCCDLVGTLERLGLKTVVSGKDEGEYPQRQAALGPARVAVVQDGNRRASLHLRIGDDWAVRPTPEQIESFHRDYGTQEAKANKLSFPRLLLDSLPAKHLAAIPVDRDRIRIDNGESYAVIERQGVASRTVLDPATTRDEPEDGPARLRLPQSSSSSYRYRVTPPADPLRLASHPSARRLLDGEFHSSQEWLDATCDSPFPDFVAQIVDAFDSPRNGDLMLFSTDHWQFARRNRGGHGGPAVADMRIPLVFAGPGVPAGGRLHAARIVDVAPTLLDYLGRPGRRAPMDGVSRWPQIQAASPAATTAPAN
ncbi:MAG: alkaline phosphatase family protein [Phycisphaerae bacterium]|nr:alkaline phosphatase family protein [Phycisphaerae bacterium]